MTDCVRAKHVTKVPLLFVSVSFHWIVCLVHFLHFYRHVGRVVLSVACPRCMLPRCLWPLIYRLAGSLG